MKPKSFNVLTSLEDSKNEPIVAGIKFNKKAGRMTVHIVPTLHGKHADRTLEKWRLEKSIVYVNKQLARSLPTTYSIKFATVVQETERANPNLLTEADFVKREPPKKPLRSVASPLGFYSQLERVIEEKMPSKASADQIRGVIKDTKQAERDWLDIDNFLKQKADFTKQEVLDYVRANNVRVEEVVRASTRPPSLS